MEVHAFRPISVRPWITLAFIFTLQVTRAQEMESIIQIVVMPGDSMQAVTSEHVPLPEVGIELKNVRSNKKYLILKGRIVHVLCTRKNGMPRIKRARLINIRDHELTFLPFNSHYVETTCADSTLRYMAFTTRGSIVRGVLVNTFLLAVLAVEILLIPIAILNGDAQYLASLGGPPISFDDFQRHIRFFRHGDRRWKVAVIANSFART